MDTIAILFLVIVLAAVILCLFGRRRLLELVEGLEAIHESAKKAREEDWRQLSAIWSGRGGWLRLLILVFGLIALGVTSVPASRRSVSGGRLLTLIGVFAAWLAFVIAILSMEAKVENPTSPEAASKDLQPRHVYIIVIVFTIVLIAGLLFFSQATP